MTSSILPVYRVDIPIGIDGQVEQGIRGHVQNMRIAINAATAY
jgi:hypothetical protein